MASEYFSDREAGPRPRVDDEIGADLWAAIRALLNRGIEGSWFAKDFPVQCNDGNGVVACDREGLMATIRAEIPELGGGIHDWELPPTLAVLDLIEFMYRHVSAVEEGTYHSFFDHRHLVFERAEGQRQFRVTANRLLSRSGTRFELDKRGDIRRVVSAVVATSVGFAMPKTIDRELDALLTKAQGQYLDPDPAIREDGLQTLWDAFERSKTVLDRDKKRGAERLISATVSGVAPEEEDLLRAEIVALTSIGNSYRIRHHETATIPLSPGLVDHLFVRMWALISRVHPAMR